MTTPARPTEPDLREAVRDCIGETIPLRRRWVNAIMSRVVKPLDAALSAATTDLAEHKAWIAVLEAERDEARADRDELTKALTGLTCGGSEFFTRRGDEYVADAQACVEYVRRGRQDKQDALIKAVRARSVDKARIAALLGVIEAGKVEAAFAFADEADGSSTATTRRIRLENIRNALDGVGDIEARKALGLLVETIDGESARAALPQGEPHAADT